MIGAPRMPAIRNGLTLMYISAYFQQMAIGAVKIGAVLIDWLRRGARVLFRKETDAIHTSSRLARYLALSHLAGDAVAHLVI